VSEERGSLSWAKRNVNEFVAGRRSHDGIAPDARCGWLS